MGNAQREQWQKWEQWQHTIYNLQILEPPRFESHPHRQPALGQLQEHRTPPRPHPKSARPNFPVTEIREIFLPSNYLGINNRDTPPAISRQGTPHADARMKSLMNLPGQSESEKRFADTPHRRHGAHAPEPALGTQSAAPFNTRFVHSVAPNRRHKRPTRDFRAFQPAATGGRRVQKVKKQERTGFKRDLSE